jgi:hypothetical protein
MLFFRPKDIFMSLVALGLTISITLLIGWVCGIASARFLKPTAIRAHQIAYPEAKKTATLVEASEPAARSEDHRVPEVPSRSAIRVRANETVSPEIAHTATPVEATEAPGPAEEHGMLEDPVTSDAQAINSPPAGGLSDQLKRLVDSGELREVRKPQKRDNGRIRHLLVTKYGEKWIIESLAEGRIC